MRNRWWAAPGIAAAVAILAACGSSAATSSGSGGSGGSASSSAPSAPSSGSSASHIKTTSALGGTVLTNSKGFTLYWFAIDTPTKSNCNGACATFWPPVIGKPTMASGTALTGKFGTITRADGKTQATYAGHPLYTYKGDTAPGQVHGNGLNIEGGLWWAVTPSGAKLTSAPNPGSSSSSGTSGGGGGYGY
jgi:predicted lipoprotein with Yx(FWY)xxD motif